MVLVLIIMQVAEARDAGERPRQAEVLAEVVVVLTTLVLMQVQIWAVAVAAVVLLLVTHLVVQVVQV
jgi:hypothetical protein